MPEVKAQFYNGSQLTFGKNRVQYSDFLWTYSVSTTSTYITTQRKELARAYSRIRPAIPSGNREKTGDHLDKKIQFIVYNTYGDLRKAISAC
jgi:hypothetical protein